MDFLDFVLRLNGKGGPSLLVPSGVLNSIQFRTSFAFHEPSFDFHVVVLGAYDRGFFLVIW